MSRTLTSREKNLLWLCLGVLVLMGSMLLANTFLQRRAKVLARAAELAGQKKENEVWLSDREFWEKRGRWLDETMPVTESLGRAQGQLLEEMQNEALNRGIKVMQQSLPEFVTTAEYQEAAVNLRLYGDQTRMLEWLAVLQSPERFQVVKELDFEIDTRSKEKTPQAQCNLTLARWFKPAGGGA